MRKIVTTLILFLLCTPVWSQQTFTLPFPTDAKEITNNPEDIKGLTWNKWETDNFIILSIDEKQGKYLFESVEKMKEWTLARWGLPELKFTNKCFICCVPNKTTMKKLFGIEKSKGEVIRNQDGSIKQSALWLVLNEKPAEIIPASLTMVTLKELETQRKIELSFWVHRGMSVLNGTVSQIKEELSSVRNVVQNDSAVFKSDAIFNMTEEEWLGESVENRDLFDKQAAMVCLLLRKELGQANLMKFVRTGSSEANLNRVYGFKGYSEFDSTLKRYMYHLANDITNNKTPNGYLQITPVIK